MYDQQNYAQNRKAESADKGTVKFLICLPGRHVNSNSVADKCIIKPIFKN